MSDYFKWNLDTDKVTAYKIWSDLNLKVFNALTFLFCINASYLGHYMFMIVPILHLLFLIYIDPKKRSRVVDSSAIVVMTMTIALTYKTGIIYLIPIFLLIKYLTRFVFWRPTWEKI